MSRNNLRFERLFLSNFASGERSAGGRWTYLFDGLPQAGDDRIHKVSAQALLQTGKIGVLLPDTSGDPNVRGLRTKPLAKIAGWTDCCRRNSRNADHGDRGFLHFFQTF